MKLYIDLESLKSLANSHDGEIMKLIKENFDVYYTFSEDDIKKEKRQKIQKIEIWQNNLSSGRKGRGVKYNAVLPIPNSFCENNDINLIPKDEFQSVFLTKDELILPSGLLTSKTDSEINVLRNLLIENKCVPAKFYYTRPEEGKEVHEWDIVSRNVSPCTDIIINDLYLFAQSENEYEANAYRLIEELCKQSKGQTISVIIVTKLTYKMREKKNNEWKDVTHTINTIAIKNDLNERIKRITQQEAMITIIALEDNYAQSRIHDRTIFTNYKLFISGDSFKYYLNQRENGIKTTNFISHGIWFGVCSLFDEEHNMIAKRFLKDIQHVISSAKKHLIFGPCISNFLK